MKKIVLLCFVAMISVNSLAQQWGEDFSAEDINGNVLYYRILDPNVQTCQIVRANYTAVERLVIPETAHSTEDGKDYTVVGIEDYAFSGNNLSSVTIPKTITSWGEGSFSENWALEEVILEDGLTTIGEDAFSWAGMLEQVTLPSTLTRLEFGAFAGCYMLSNIYLNDGLTYIGGAAFEECESLYSIDIPSTVTYIGDYAFSWCPITEIFLPDGLTSIGISAFEFTELESVHIPGSVTYMGAGSFADCYSLTTVTFGEGLTSVGNMAFLSCWNLSSVTLPSTLISLEGEAFRDCPSLSEITLPSSLKIVGDSVFFDTDVNTTIPDGVEYIGDYAFCGPDIPSLVVPASVTHMGKSAFQGSTKTIDATILATVDSLSERLFYNSTHMTTLSIPKTVGDIGDHAFDNCYSLESLTSLNYEAPICGGTGVFTSVPTSTCILYVPKGAEEAYASAPYWENFSHIEGIEVDYGPNEDKFEEGGIYYNIIDAEANTVEVTYKSTAFNYYSGSIAIPTTVVHDGKVYNVTSIAHNAFRLSPELTSVTIAEGVTSLGRNVFYECTSLKEVSLPSSMTEIEEYAFYDCSALEEITIPASVTTIGNNAFYNCTSLTTLTIEDGDDVLSFANNRTFYGCPLSSLFLGRNLEYDSSSSPFSPFYDITTLIEVTIGENVTNLGSYLFRHCTGLEAVTIPMKVTILYGTFQSCHALADITLPEGLTSMDYAFYDCTALEEVAIPSTVTSAVNAFDGCTKLKKVKLLEGVSEISNYMFYQCSSLTEIDLPSSIGKVGNYAFYQCTSLERLNFMEGEKSYSIGNYAFDHCSNLTSILFPKNVAYIGSCSLGYCESLKKFVLPNQTGENTGETLRYDSALEEVILCAQAQSISRYIASGQFHDCTSLAKIYVLSDVAPNVANSNAFTNVPTETCTLYVPVGSKESYENDTYWKVFTNIEELSNPLPVTYCVGNVTSDSAQINGLVAVGSEGVNEVGFEYWAEGDDTPTVIVISDSFTATDELHATLADLAYGMTYTYRVYAKTASETLYGDEVTFTLPIDGAKVFTLEASSITETTAVLNGRLVLPENESATEQGFEYWAEGGETQSVTVSGNSLTYALENLTPKTIYTYYAFATLASGPTIYGDKVEFTTLGTTETDITNVEANGLEDENIEGYYTPDGRAISAPQKGVNIIHYRDGVAKKIYIK